jgi:uroporphyrinogen-III synthase
MAGPSFNGRRVLALESRRAAEIRTLIERMGGVATVAPALQEVPLEADPGVREFAAAVSRGEYDLILFLTGVGVRALVGAIERALPAPAFAVFIDALSRTRLAARGPKPVAALRERGLTPWAVAPEPNTWRELIAAIDAGGGPPLAGARVAVQEYGVPNPELVDALAARGARVTTLHAYEWALPDDLGPLQAAVRAIAAGEIDVVLVTSGVQMRHLLEVADRIGAGQDVRRRLSSMVVASIGPSASAELRRLGIQPTLEASPPKMGMLVRQAAG